jgi:hypothetical protein
MPSNIAIIPGMKPVPTILMVAPPAADPTDGRTSVTVGAALDGVGEAGTTDGEVGNPDD